MTGPDELLEPFLLEARELVERAGAELAGLARGDPAAAGLAGLFRSVHTLKGSVALVGLPVLERLLHAAESRLAQARAAARLEDTDADLITRVLDLTDRWLDALDAGETPEPALEAATAELAAALGAEDPAGAGPDAADWTRALPTTGAMIAIRYTPDGEAYFRGDDPLALMRAVPGLAHLKLSVEPPPDGPYDPFHCRLRIQALSSAPLSDVRASLRLVADQVELSVTEPAPGLAADTPGAPALRALRVDPLRLDRVAAMVDELVIAKNALLYETDRLLASADARRERALANSQAALERVVADLHGAVTNLRLTPLGQLFSRFPRQVREMSAAVGKDVEFLASGGQVSVDKSVVEGLFEPLLHLLRNAIDHGVEAPAERTARGKPARALITVAAQARGDHITLDVADDGRGIDVERVRQAAVARGVLDAHAAAALDDTEAAGLVFSAGFSTAQSVGLLSGRGVGLDAVRAAVAQMGGAIGLENRPGLGLTVRLTLPAQIVLTKVLVVTSAGERFGVPLETVGETHRVRAQEVTEIRAGRAYVRRHDVIPILRLNDLLGGRGEGGGGGSRDFPVLTVMAGGEKVGIEVDEISERLEAPLRPMRGLLAGFPGLLGTILQGDGQVLLVLDLPELAA